jgi:hypothetical protein
MSFCFRAWTIAEHLRRATVGGLSFFLWRENRPAAATYRETGNVGSVFGGRAKEYLYKWRAAGWPFQSFVSELPSLISALKPPIPIQSASSLKSSVTGPVPLRRKSLEFIPEILSTRIEQVSRSVEIKARNWLVELVSSFVFSRQVPL